MSANASAFPKREVVQFPPNQPITLALKYASPRIGMRPGGEDYAMFTTVDDRVMFLDPEVARQITDLGVKPGEAFQMELQWTGRRGDPKIYHAWQDEPGDAAEPAESALEAQLRASIDAVKAKKAGPALSAPALPAPQSHPESSVNMQQLQGSNPWAARVREQTQMKLAIYSELCCWAKENLPGVTRNEVRAILMNVMISTERNGAK